MGQRPLDVRLSLPPDDAGIRALLRRSVMDGGVQLAFTREPSYERGAGLAGSRDASVVALRDETIYAMGRCSVQPLMRNGNVEQIGYLGELRSDPQVPGVARAMRPGYAELAAAGKAAGAKGFVTVIADANVRARRVLEHGGRLGLPRYTPLAGLVTLVIPVPNNVRPAPGPGDRSALTAFLAARAAEGQLALDWGAARWELLARHGVALEDACVVHERGHIVAAGIVWDQRGFKQTRVMGYRGALALARPFVNAAARLTGNPRLPPPNSVLAQGTALAVSVTKPSAWRPLIEQLRARAAAKGLSWMAITRDRRDPAVATLLRVVRARTYHTTLYEVSFAGMEGFRTPWDDRLMRPEAGLL